MQSRFLFGLGSLCLSLILLSHVIAEAPTSPAPTKIVVLADPAQTSGPTATARYDFGRRSVLDTSPITHTFILRSQAQGPVTVDRLQPSCRCTSAIMEGVKDETAPFTLSPGQQVAVRVVISPGDALPGPFEKEVYVFMEGESTPTITLQLAGILTPPVTFQPDTLQFKHAARQNVPDQVVTVTVDARLLASGQALRLRSDNPAVQVTPLSPTKPSTQTGALVRSFLIKLSAGQTERFRAVLSVVPTAGVSSAFPSDVWGTAVVTSEAPPGKTKPARRD